MTPDTLKWRRPVLFALGTALLLIASTAAAETDGRQNIHLPQLPPCVGPRHLSVCDVRRDWDAVQLEEKLDADRKAVWTEDDVWMVAYQTEAEAVFLNGGIQTMLTPLPEGDLWVLAAYVPDLPKATIGYGFLAFTGSQPDFSSQVFYSWRGPDAPPEPAHADPLAGTLTTYTLGSAYLDAPRDVTVYLPPHYDPAQPAPVVYMTDGQMLADFAPYVEPLIVDGTLPPLILVGVHAAQSAFLARDNARAAEYLIGYAQDGRFEKHEKFFMEEVTAWAEGTFGASSDPDQRVFFGVSDGAAFVLTMKQRHPEQVNDVIAFAVAGSGPVSGTAAPGRYYLFAGTLDIFHGRTLYWVDRLTTDQTQVVFRDRVGGHDSLIWREELPLALQWVFGGSQ